MDNFFDDEGTHGEEVGDETTTLIQEIINALESVLSNMGENDPAHAKLCEAADKADALQNILRTM
ncbi:hypothetical protein DY926_12050 [Komagataeibacter melaceti]|uniref:Uncharacterized protein n=1 Tax=Komagataeibacter melaceti TaxID=2766577 RepID=A0A371YYG5_9PROT|nr:hypothetical protein [Komagataeibacter melaceti]RFD19275.1 hypothetical protein DY926_12050 [Komagataeibacter melaceti]